MAKATRQFLLSGPTNPDQAPKAKPCTAADRVCHLGTPRIDNPPYLGRRLSTAPDEADRQADDPGTWQMLAYQSLRCRTHPNMGPETRK